MIRINKDETKEVIFTLTEKSTLSTPYYLFEIVSNDTGNKVYFTNDDFSFNTERFNSFTFSEGGPDPLNGGFTLDPGSYDYFVWETEYSDNLSVASASNVVERGLFEVIGTVPSSIYTEIDGSTQYVYDPNSSISGDAPVASFQNINGVITYPTYYTIPLFDTSTNTPTSWDWDVNGDISTVQNPTFDVYTSGTLSVSMTASNDFGSDNFTYDYCFIIGNEEPIASFTYSVISGNTVEFTNTSTGTHSVNYWNINTGDEYIFSSATFSYTFLSSSGNTVQLIIRDICGRDRYTTHIPIVI